MNLFLIGDIVSLVLVVIVMVFLVSFKGYEDDKLHASLNSLLFGLFFVMLYFILSIVGFLLLSFNYSDSAVVYSSTLIVVPLAAIFFFVSVLLHSD